MNQAACLSTFLTGTGVLLAACSAPATRATLPSSRPAAPSTISVGVRDGNRLTIRKVPVETYVQAAILSEFAPSAGDPDLVERMLEVQAVIGRTYALANLGRHQSEGFDVCATTHCQLYEPSRLTTSRWAPQAAAAVGRTTATVLWFGGAPAVALYHADCGGRTSRAEDVWRGLARPYLVSIVDDGPAERAHAAVWRFDASDLAVVAALNSDARTRVGPRLDGIQVLNRDQAGRAEQIALHGSQERTVRGEDLRDVLGHRFGIKAIRSTWFTVQKSGRAFVFEGRGYGHGVGLCQAGAFARVRSGAKLTDVLDLYFPGTKLVTLRQTALRNANH